jgi:transcriptional regulator with XRE-family HTH domain
MAFMAQKTAALLPVTGELLRRFGDRLRLARLRRRLSAKQVAERAGMAPMTLRSLERGGSGVTIGAYLAVMQVLGIEQDLDLLGRSDPVGRELQDARLPARAKTSRSDGPATVGRQASDRRPSSPANDPPKRRPVGETSLHPHEPEVIEAPDEQLVEKPRAPSDAAVPDWITESGFTSADALAGLIEPAAPPRDEDR